MSSTEKLPMDELILQIFEEQEDQFFYPVTSQNTARNFVKALTAKGLATETVCQEIEEFEHNFSAWRKGLGRVGIGKRIIERINKPVHEVLLSDDEDDVNEILSRIKERESSSKRPANNRVPPITQVAPTLVHTEETRILKLRENVLKNNANTAAEKSQGTEKVIPQSNLRAGSSSPERSGSDGETRTGSKVPAAQLKQKEPGVVDFRSVLKRRSNVPDDNGALAAVNRKSMPPPDIIPDRSQSTKSQKKAEPVKEKADQNEKPAGKKEADKSEKSPTKPASLKLTKTTSAVEHKDVFDAKNDVDREFEGEKEFDNSFENEAPEKASTEKSATKQPAPLAAQELDESLSTSGSESSASDTESSSAEESASDDQTETVEPNGAGESEESEDSEPRDYDPNYDSDLDEENNDILREGKRIVQQISNYKSKVASRDGPGYLYVFRDRSSQLAKISESRMPKKRLEQALCFNINLEMVSALPVSLRQLSAQRARTRLARFQVRNQATWFKGPMDEIIRVVTSTAERYPKNSSQC